MRRIRRILSWFDKTGDHHLGSAPLRGLTLAAMRSLFDAPPDDPMVECYPLRAEHVALIQHHTDQPIHIELHDYFVECEALAGGDGNKRRRASRLSPVASKSRR